MPAVKSFALYAALAVLMDFALQMTAFVALLSLDARRQDNNRCELLCCIKVSKQRPKKPNKGFLMPFMKKYYAPVLLHRYTRIIVVMPHQQHKTYSVHSYSKPLTSAVSLMLNPARWNLMRWTQTHIEMCVFLNRCLINSLYSMFSSDSSFHLYVLWSLIPHDECESGFGSGAGYASGQ